MPNWCTTGITFYSKDKELVEKLHGKLLKIMDGKPTAENDFGNGWLGDYANTFFPELGWEKIRCRGSVEDIDELVFERKGYWFFAIATLTAWSAMMGMWREIVEKFYKGIEIAYISEECGLEYFLKYDETGLFYPEVMYVECYYPDENGDEQYIDRHNFDTVADVVKWLDKNIPQFSHTITDSLDSLAHETGDGLQKLGDNFFFIADRYKEVPLSEFDF